MRKKVTLPKVKEIVRILVDVTCLLDNCEILRFSVFLACFSELSTVD